MSSINPFELVPVKKPVANSGVTREFLARTRKHFEFMLRLQSLRVRIKLCGRLSREFLHFWVSSCCVFRKVCFVEIFPFYRFGSRFGRFYRCVFRSTLPYFMVALGTECK